MRRLALAVVGVLTALAVAAPPVPSAASECGSAGAPTSTVYLPNITKTLGGPNGWVTPFIVQNVGVAATTLEVSFYRFSDGALIACRSVAGLLPGNSFADVPNGDADLPDGGQFSVVVRSFGSEVVSVVNEQQGVGERAEALSYVGLSEGSTSVALPYVVKAKSGWTTTVVIQNLGSAAATVTVGLASADGALTATLTRTIDAGRSRFIDPGAEAGLVAGTEYSALLSSDQPIAAVVNAHNDAPTVVAPRGFSYNGIAIGSAGSAYLPYVARDTDGGRTTRILVENTGTKDATPTLTFRGDGGQLVSVTAPAPVKPGRAWSFDPSFQANGTSACPTAGTATCVGTGRHGLVVTGGAFAVVGVSLSGSTAMGMAAVRAAAQRTYLPNITRTLGGPSGWTTPIVLQSAGATSAVLRWYRFADGALAVTQYVPGLVAGASKRIDPRDVPGLGDGAQYAVVVDAAMGAAAAVLELNDLGGDGSMAYEGFAATGPVSAVPAPTSIALSPPEATVGLGSTQQFTATVMDASGNAMTGVPLIWSVSPSSLGTIDANGLFTAGAATGTGSVTARFGSIAATAPVSVAATTVTVGGFTFAWRETASADVYTEASITSADATTIATTVEADVASVQATYARAFEERPAVYVFATTGTYTTGLEAVLGMPALQAATAGPQTYGVFWWTGASSSGRIALNWAKVKTQAPATTARHELTHMMFRQIARPSSNDTIPAWLNEGSARLQEFTIDGTDHWEMQNRYTAASMVAARQYFTVSDLASQDVWNARTGQPAIRQYDEASQIVQLLRDDVGTFGVTRMLELVGQGVPFEEAYLAITGEELADFSAAVPARLQAISASYPGIATADDVPGGNGLSFILYGFAPSSAVTLAIRGSRTGAQASVTRIVDPYGVYASFLGSDWPRDTYSITGTGLTPPSSTQPNTTVTVRVTAAKASSLAWLARSTRAAVDPAPVGEWLQVQPEETP